jgi:hypothetical protein
MHIEQVRGDCCVSLLRNVSLMMRGWERTTAGGIMTSNLVLETASSSF